MIENNKINDNDFPLTAKIYKKKESKNTQYQFAEMKAVVNVGLQEQDLFAMAKLSEEGCCIQMVEDVFQIWYHGAVNTSVIASYPIAHGDTIFNLINNALKSELKKEKPSYKASIEKLLFEIEKALA